MPNFATTPLPKIELLSVPPVDNFKSNSSKLIEMARLIESSLALYHVAATVAGISQGPIFTTFELRLAPGVTVSRVATLAHDLARVLSAEKLRILHVIPGKPHIGIEVLNTYRHAVYLRKVLDSSEFRRQSSPLAVALGKDITGKSVVVDLACMPHLLIGGMTGSGKSVLLDAVILSILYRASPQEVRFIMIDPKMLDLSFYEGIPHLLTNVITDMQEAVNALCWCMAEMERRFKLMYALGVRQLTSYNDRIELATVMGRPLPDPFWKPSSKAEHTPPVLEKEPYIVVVVDNIAELMMAAGEQAQEMIVSLAQKAHSVGIHIIMSTSLPSVTAIASAIKASIPTRIALTVRSKGDSSTILGQGGAELLMGAGDMLYMAANSNKPQRVHGAFVNEQDIYAVVRDWKIREWPQNQPGIFNSGGVPVETDFDEELDPLFDEAVTFVIDERRVSVFLVQRQFRIGYNRANRIIEKMEELGIISEQGSNGNRKVIVPIR
ncbi:hypothetical protein IBZ12_20280 [Serratia ureilytica]|uniref:DNA translocase FtsK n=1 Tax=Serratia ureilytica TaxID=300181 RepID=UPI0039B3AF89